MGRTAWLLTPLLLIGSGAAIAAPEPSSSPPPREGLAEALVLAFYNRCALAEPTLDGFKAVLVGLKKPPGFDEDFEKLAAQRKIRNSHLRLGRHSGRTDRPCPRRSSLPAAGRSGGADP